MSYHSLYYHIIFSTKNRNTYLDDAQLEEMYKYMSGVIKSMKAKLFLVNGPSDHVHIALSMSPDVSISDCARTIKANTSRWIHERFEGLRDFAWQEGYSAFSVSKSNIQSVTKYIQNQREHHKTISFEEELKSFLKKHHIEYNPKYFPG
ncbi:MAG: IS200/IS605 family transposase [Phycisphaerae bacterium]|nr:IS200/IS605 family transposase [Phycisphaerae bacterium]